MRNWLPVPRARSSNRGGSRPLASRRPSTSPGRRAEARRAAAPYAAALAVGAALGACGGGGSVSDWDTARGEATVTLAEARAADDAVTAIDPVCYAQERCNGRDSDCDGHIDEGCEGVEPGALEVALAWNGAADLDLVLEGASDVVRQDAGGACEPYGDYVERARVDALAPGELTLAVRHADACDGEEPVTASLAVTLRGEPVGLYNRAIEPGATHELARLTLTTRPAGP